MKIILRDGITVVRDYEMKGWVIVNAESGRNKRKWTLAKNDNVVIVSYNGLYRITTVKEGR